ncbi:phage holin family protein [Altererythrobacter sp. ZODW24]|uniref:phage holin family protein n=1 Tax=Altererythrobacter sp. ZODW24 TaxID=2185142 RepID=UPI000DF72FA5|nr:phage holin family protein [Altererythrobacter sp. ZODW24]
MAEQSLPEIDEAKSPDDEPLYDGSIIEDVKATIDDGKTYLQAEIGFQKTRAAYAAGEGKRAAGLGLAALACLHLALIGLVVGLIFGLSPLLTPLGATAAVVGTLLAFVVIFALLAGKRASNAAKAFKDPDQ